MPAEFTEQNDGSKVSLLLEGNFRILAEALPHMVWTSEPGGAITYCNRLNFLYFGARDVDEMNRLWPTYIHPEDRPIALRAWQRSLETGEPYECQYRLRRFDGTYREFLARAAAALDRDGRIVGWVGSITDIHEQKQLEVAMRKSEKLAIAGRLAANIAHELNNPLSSITNALYLAMQDNHLSDTSRAYLKLADSELRRIATVTRQTLRFHRQSSEPARVDLREVANSILQSLNTSNSAPVQVERQYHESGILFCYAEDVRQALTSVISNALDAMRHGGRLIIRIRRARSSDNATSGIRITIADSGSGIPAYLLPDVCEPFLTTKEATGTGLGLWVTKRIMERHHGILRIRSNTDARRHGTVVVLFFPYAGVLDNA